MKKVTLSVFAIIIVLSCLVYYYLNQLGPLVAQQIESFGSETLATEVTVKDVQLQLLSGLGAINTLSIANPNGFSDQSALSFATARLDLGDYRPFKKQLVIEEIWIDQLTALYEVNAQRQGNLNILSAPLRNNSTGNNQNTSKTTADTEELLIRVNRIVIKDTQLQLDLTALGGPNAKETLPTFYANDIGSPNGLPPQELAHAIAQTILKNLVSDAMAKQKQRLRAHTITTIKEKVSDKFKTIFNTDE